MHPLIRLALGCLAGYGAGVLMDKLCDVVESHLLEPHGDALARALRRVELQERAEQLEAELAGVHLVREAPAPSIPIAPPGGLFGPIEPGEA